MSVWDKFDQFVNEFIEAGKTTFSKSVDFSKKQLKNIEIKSLYMTKAQKNFTLLGKEVYKLLTEDNQTEVKKDDPKIAPLIEQLNVVIQEIKEREEELEKMKEKA